VVDQAIDDNADAILVACSMRKKHGRATVGDAVDYILRNAPCEVIIVRTPVNESATAGEPQSVNIVIMGCGRVGARVASILDHHGHTVSVIDTSSAAFRRLGPGLRRGYGHRHRDR
jgi:hypothetical protein